MGEGRVDCGGGGDMSCMMHEGQKNTLTMNRARICTNLLFSVDVPVCSMVRF